MFILILLFGVVYGDSISTTTPRVEPPAQSRELSYMDRWPEPVWISRFKTNNNDINNRNQYRSLRFTADDVKQAPSNIELARDYRFEPYYRGQQDLSYDHRNRDRDIYDSPRYYQQSQDRPVYSPPRRIIYFDDLSNRGNRGGPLPSPSYYPAASNTYDRYRGGPYGYPEQGRNFNYNNNNNNYNSLYSAGIVENAPLVDSRYQNYNPRQPAPWSVQVGTSLTVKDDGRHGSPAAARRFYVQSDEPTIGRSLGGFNSNYYNPRLSDSRLWEAMKPKV